MWKAILKYLLWVVVAVCYALGVYHYTPSRSHDQPKCAEYSDSLSRYEVIIAATDDALEQKQTKTNKREKAKASLECSDLKAQWAMADITFWAFGAGVAGIILIFLTWIATRQAVGVSKDSAKDQTRAYVFVDGATFNMRTSGMCIMLNIKNTGATPAKWFEVGSKSTAIPIATKLEADFTTINDFTRWPAIANGHHLTTGADPTTEAKHIAEAVGDSNLTFYIYGIIRYMTAYDEIFEF